MENKNLPTFAELSDDNNELALKDNKLMVLLNQAPPDKWLSEHPIIKIKNKDGNRVPLKYLPIEYVEYLLSRVFTKWWVDVKNIQCIANSVVVTVRLFVVNPITQSEEWQDGIGAVGIQTDEGKGAMDWNFAKADGVMKAAPSAESYAIKDAAEKFGKLFGKDLNRKENIIYDGLLKDKKQTQWTQPE